jgi:hypothetical protein
MRKLLIVAAFILPACTPVKLQPVSHDCVAIVDYTDGDERQAAGELLAMQDANHHPRYPMVSRMITDYGRERAALKPCQSGNEGWLT